MDLFCYGKRDSCIGRRKSLQFSSPANRVALFMIGHGGGGHTASAIAVRDCLHALRDGTLNLNGAGIETPSGSPWLARGWHTLVPTAGPIAVELVDAGEIVGGTAGDDFYNWLMQGGCYSTAGYLGYAAACSVKLGWGLIESSFETLWAERQPTVVVSFVPFLNARMRASLLRTCPKCHLVTVITDMTTTAAHQWIDQQDDSARNQIIVAGTTDLVEQAYLLGYTQTSILCTSGMVVHPAFYAAAREAATEEKALSSAINQHDGVGDDTISHQRPKAVIYFGGHAPMRAERVARHFMDQHPSWAVVILCGHNHDLFNSASQLQTGDITAEARCIVEGFLGPEALARHLASAAIILGKPGPGAVAEADVCHVPFVTERQSVLPQEEAVLHWLEANNAGMVIEDLECLPANLLVNLQLLWSKRREEQGRQPNRAVMEVAEYLNWLVQ